MWRGCTRSIPRFHDTTPLLGVNAAKFHSPREGALRYLLASSQFVNFFATASFATRSRDIAGLFMYTISPYGRTLYHFTVCQTMHHPAKQYHISGNGKIEFGSRILEIRLLEVRRVDPEAMRKRSRSTSPAIDDQMHRQMEEHLVWLPSSQFVR